MLPHLKDKLLWIDVETTGLDPFKDSILEIGLVITNSKLETLDSMSQVVSIEQVDRTWDPVVIEMHSKSGLLLDCLTGGSSIAAVLSNCHDYIWGQFFNNNNHLDSPKYTNGQLNIEERPRLCGSSVHFDHIFLERACRTSVVTELSKPDRLLHYRHLDVSTIGGLYEMYRPDMYDQRPKDRKIHRVLHDIEDSIAQMRFYLYHMPEMYRKLEDMNLA